MTTTRLSSFWQARGSGRLRGYSVHSRSMLSVGSAAGPIPLFRIRAPFWALLPGQGGSSKRIYFFNYGAVPWTEFEESCWEKAKETFRDGIEVSRASGVEIILLYVPIKFRVYREFITIPPRSPLTRWDVWPLPQKFMEFCRSVSVPCVDLTDRLKQAVREGMDVYALNDTHWSSEGNAVVAAELERVLRGLDLLKRGALASQDRGVCTLRDGFR